MCDVSMPHSTPVVSQHELDDLHDLSLFDCEDMFDLLDIPQPAVPQTAHRVPLAMEEMPAFGAQELSCQAPLLRKDMYGGATESKLLHQLQELFDDSSAFDDSSYSSNDSHVSSGSDEDSHPTVIEGRRPHGLKRPGSSQGQGRVKRVARAGASSPKRKPARLLLWRKYGQKHLKGDQKGIVRCYYRCYDPLCPAKRFIDKPAGDLSRILETRHEAAHTHPVSPDFEDIDEAKECDLVRSESLQSVGTQ